MAVSGDLVRRPRGAVEVLIGSCEPGLLTPQEVRTGTPGEAVAVRYTLGWAVSGPTGGERRDAQVVVSLTSDLKDYFRLGFEDESPAERRTVEQRRNGERR